MKEDEDLARELRGAMEDDEEIGEEAPLLQPQESRVSEIANDRPELASVTPPPVLIIDINADIYGAEDSDNLTVSGRDVDVEAPKKKHDLRALATVGNKMSVENRPKSVDVEGPDGVIKRFAKGTKAAFAIERFNCQLKDPSLPVVCIVACKDGEDPIEFGPDVELVSYDDTWTLKTLREAVQDVSGNPVKEDFIHNSARVASLPNPITQVPVAPYGTEEINTKQNDSTKPTRESTQETDALRYFGVKNWEDLYPEGKIPEGGSQDCTPQYVGKMLVMFIFVFAFAGGLIYMLEQLPDPSRSLQ